MEIQLNLGRNTSLSSNLNFFATSGNISIMDNHLGAIHVLDGIGRTGKRVDFFHLDQHYDLGHINDDHEQYLNGQVTPDEISELTSHKTTMGVNLFLWDNYIHLFCEKYPNIINHAYFITHGTTEFSYDHSEFSETTIFQLMNMSFSEEEALILNIDIDYFFYTEKYGKTIKPFSHELLIEFTNWLVKRRDKFQKIIIAMSPECCGGWDQSLEVTNHLLEPLNMNIEI